MPVRPSSTSLAKLRQDRHKRISGFSGVTFESIRGDSYSGQGQHQNVNEGPRRCRPLTQRLLLIRRVNGSRFVVQYRTVAAGIRLRSIFANQPSDVEVEAILI